MKLGAYDLYHRARFDAAMATQGRTVPWSRRYYQNQSASSMGAVATDAAAGKKVMFSFKGASNSASDWPNIAGGSEDARWAGIGNMLAAIPNGGWYCFHHEPENDAPAGQYGSGTYGDQFRAAFDRIANIIRPLAPHWKACANLFDVVFPSWEFVTKPGNWGGGGPSSTDPNRWIPATAEILGVDYYAFRGAADSSTGATKWANSSRVYNYNAAITDFLSYADSHGIPLAFPEFGYMIRDPALTPGDEANRTTWLQGVANQFGDDPRIAAVMWFEVNFTEIINGVPTNTGKCNTCITDPTTPPMDTGTIAAFAAFDALDPEPPPPPPPEYIPGLITVAGHMRMHT